jgi:putative transposase
LAQVCRIISDRRQNTLHQLTTQLAKTKSVVVIEDLHVSGMLRNHHLAQAIADAGCAAFWRHLVYKAVWYSCRVLLADRWEASSNTCTSCGWVNEDLTLRDRTFERCDPEEPCGLVLDRDLNAAINVSKRVGSSSQTQNACGEESAGRRLVALVKRSPLQQEPDASDASA